MEIEHQLGNGMPINATTYSGERHVCTRIDKFQSGLARFARLSANSDSRGEKVKHFLNRGQFLASLITVMYRTVSLSKPYTQKATWAQSIVTAVWCELAIRRKKTLIQIKCY